MLFSTETFGVPNACCMKASTAEKEVPLTMALNPSSSLLTVHRASSLGSKVFVFACPPYFVTSVMRNEPKSPEREQPAEMPQARKMVMIKSVRIVTEHHR